MPTYQYACTACDHRFEAVQSFSDASLRECPECSGLLRKVFTSVGVVFKGSGFYRTDSRKGSTVGASSDGPKESGSSSDSTKNGSATNGSTGSSATSGSSSSSTPAPAAAAS